MSFSRRCFLNVLFVVALQDAPLLNRTAVLLLRPLQYMYRWLIFFR
jgi:hypothetical protein